jgi:hypothetical protein
VRRGECALATQPFHGRTTAISTQVKLLRLLEEPIYTIIVFCYVRSISSSLDNCQRIVIAGVLTQQASGRSGSTHPKYPSVCAFHDCKFKVACKYAPAKMYTVKISEPLRIIRVISLDHHRKPDSKSVEVGNKCHWEGFREEFQSKHYQIRDRGFADILSEPTDRLYGIGTRKRCKPCSKR